MFETDTTNFENLVEKSETLKTKWTAVYQAVQNDIKDRYGVEVDEKTVCKIDEVRLFTLSANEKLDQGEYSKQVEALPQLAEIIKIRQIAAGNMVIRRAAEAEIAAMPNNGSESDLRARINKARVLGIATSGAEYDDSGLSHEQKVQQLLTISNVAQRISKARAWGILK